MHLFCAAGTSPNVVIETSAYRRDESWLYIWAPLSRRGRHMFPLCIRNVFFLMANRQLAHCGCRLGTFKTRRAWTEAFWRLVSPATGTVVLFSLAIPLGSVSERSVASARQERKRNWTLARKRGDRPRRMSFSGQCRACRWES